MIASAAAQDGTAGGVVLLEPVARHQQALQPLEIGRALVDLAAEILG